MVVVAVVAVVEVAVVAVVEVAVVVVMVAVMVIGSLQLTKLSLSIWPVCERESESVRVCVFLKATHVSEAHVSPQRGSPQTEFDLWGSLGNQQNHPSFTYDLLGLLWNMCNSQKDFKGQL